MNNSELNVKYSGLVDTKTHADLVLKDGVIFNNRYDGTPAPGGAVKVRKGGAVNVSNYDKTNGVEQTERESSWITVEINKDVAINEIIDGYDAASIPDGLVADTLSEAGYSMASALDSDGAYELVTAGTTLEDTDALTKTTVYSKIVDARTALTRAGVPKGDRYIIVAPEVYALILKCDEFVKPSGLGDAVVQTGAAGSIAGFTVYESVNLGDGVEFVAGHPGYATRVNAWAVPVNIKDCTDGKHIGASQVQGRKVYAHKVTNPDCILVKTTNF